MSSVPVLCLCKYPFLQLSFVYSLHREVLRKRILRQYIYKKCTKNVQTTVLAVQVVRRCVFMVRMVHVADV